MDYDRRKNQKRIYVLGIKKNYPILYRIGFIFLVVRSAFRVYPSSVGCQLGALELQLLEKANIGVELYYPNVKKKINPFPLPQRYWA